MADESLRPYLVQVSDGLHGHQVIVRASAAHFAEALVAARFRDLYRTTPGTEEQRVRAEAVPITFGEDGQFWLPIGS